MTSVAETSLDSFKCRRTLKVGKRSYDYFDLKEAEATAAMKRVGHTTHTLDAAEEEAWFQEVRPVFDEYVKEKSAKSLPAAEALTFDGIFADKTIDAVVICLSRLFRATSSAGRKSFIAFFTPSSSLAARSRRNVVGSLGLFVRSMNVLTI